MSDPALKFSESEQLGLVTGVDTRRVTIDVNEPALLARVAVGNLVAIQGPTKREFLIGITERVTRSVRDEIPDIEDVGGDETDIPLTARADDTVRVVLIGTYRTVDGDKKNVFKRGADAFPQIDRECYLVEGGNLQRFMGLLAAGVDPEQQLKLGTFVADRTADAIANGDKFFQRHAAILGSTGSGKSWSVALILERANSLKHPNLIVLDMHGEYAPLADSKTGFASGWRVAGPGDLDTPDDNVLFLPYWLLNREELISLLLDRSDQNAPNQASRLCHHVRQLKESGLKKLKKDDVLKSFTMDSPVPFALADLLQELSDDDTRKGVGANNKPVKGEWEGKLTRFLSRLQAKVEDRRYGFLFQPPADALKYDWLANQLQRLLGTGADNRGIKVIDFSEVPSDILPLVVGVFARLLYDAQFWTEPAKRTPLTLLCDEAHLYLPVRDDADVAERQALAAFERIAKEGRKYGVSLLVVSQRPSDVSRTILSQANNFLVLRLTNDRDQSVVRRLVPDSMSGLTDILPLLDTGEALLLGDAVVLPTRIRLDAPKIQPSSATRDFWQEWSSMAPDSKAIAEAVETMRRQTRPS